MANTASCVRLSLPRETVVVRAPIVKSKMSNYSQASTKRQKVRDGRSVDVEYFQGIERVEYNKMASAADTTTYRCYNSGERVHSRPMEDWLKLSVSFTDFRDNTSGNIPNWPWDDRTNTIDNHKRCLRAFFELCSKLGVKSWSALDTDLVPATDNYDETKAYWDDMLDYIQEISPRYNMKLMSLAPDLHSHYRYISGALTSNDASTFIQAAAQIKRCLEISQKLAAECFLLWPYREGYDAIFQTDVARELKLFAKLLKITADYKDRLHFKCQLLIMPYYSLDFCNFNSSSGGSMWQHRFWRETDIVKRYMWDVASCLYFLKNFNLEKYYKVCTPPGHHFHMASVYNALGGVFITDSDHHDNKSLTLMMKTIIDQAAPPAGGVLLRLRAPPGGGVPRALVAALVSRVDAAARALRCAARLANEQALSKHLQQRYSSYYSGVGARIVSSDVSIEELDEHHKKFTTAHTQSVEAPPTEHYDLVFQRYIDTCDHI